MKAKKNRWGSVYLAIMLLFMYAPIVVLIFYSFNANKSMAKWGGFSLKWYAALFQDRTILSALQTTLIVAVLSALIATVIGTAAAIGIDAMGKKRRNVILTITNLPVVNPDLVTGVSLMLLYVFGFSLLSRVGIHGQLGFGTLLVSHITFNIPYVILSVMPRLRSNSDLLYEAALDLGAKPMFAVRKIILPDIMPGVVTGFILAFTMSLDDFVVSFFTRQGVQTLSLVIYSMARRGISPKINALSALMFVAVLILLLIINIRGARQDRKARSMGRPTKKEKKSSQQRTI